MRAKTDSIRAADFAGAIIHQRGCLRIRDKAPRHPALIAGEGNPRPLFPQPLDFLQPTRKQDLFIGSIGGAILCPAD